MGLSRVPVKLKLEHEAETETNFPRPLKCDGLIESYVSGPGDWYTVVCGKLLLSSGVVSQHTRAGKFVDVCNVIASYFCHAEITAVLILVYGQNIGFVEQVKDVEIESNCEPIVVAESDAVRQAQVGLGEHWSASKVTALSFRNRNEEHVDERRLRVSGLGSSKERNVGVVHFAAAPIKAIGS